MLGVFDNFFICNETLIDRFFLFQTQTNGDVVVSNGNNMNAANAKILDSSAATTTTSTNDDKMWLPANGTKEPCKWTVSFIIMIRIILSDINIKIFFHRCKKFTNS